MVKLQENKNRFFVSISKEKVAKKKWKKGQRLDWNYNQDGDLVLSEVE